MVERQELPELLDGPFRRRMRGRKGFRYLRTVRGDTAMRNFRDSSFAIRASPQVGFSRSIFRISSRRFVGSGGRPFFPDFHLQNIRNAVRCHSMNVSRLTMTSAFSTRRIAPVRWVRSIKQECLSKLIVFGPRRLWRLLNEYSAHYRSDDHQGKENLLLFPKTPIPDAGSHARATKCRHRLAGLLKYYERAA